MCVVSVKVTIPRAVVLLETATTGARALLQTEENAAVTWDGLASFALKRLKCADGKTAESTGSVPRPLVNAFAMRDTWAIDASSVRALSTA